MPAADLDRFLLAAARYRLENTGLDEVVDAAALQATHAEVSSTLTRIAALVTGENRREDVLPLLDQALAENGQPPLDAEAAALIVARHIATSIVDNQIEPYQGARDLWRLARATPEVEPTLAVFIHLASEWEDVPDQRDDIATDIKTEAAKLAHC